MSTHTPGPWEVREYDGERGYRVYIVAPFTDDEPIPFNDCTVITDRVGGVGLDGEFVANAHLIASAPELLVALRDLVNSLERSDEEGLIGHVPEIQAARAAIAKAEGKQ